MNAARMKMILRCENEGKQARRDGKSYMECPYGGKRGTGRAMYDAWQRGWSEEDREQRMMSAYQQQ